MDAPTPDPRLRARRAALAVVIASAFGILAGLCVITARYEAIYVQLETRKLPPPTELFLSLASGVRSIPGALVLAGVCAAFVWKAWRGAFDGRRRRATLACIVGVFLLIGFWVLAVAMPLIRIQQHLSK